MGEVKRRDRAMTAGKATQNTTPQLHKKCIIREVKYLRKPMNSGYKVFATTKNNPIQEATASEIQ
jgi:hypothetical protein